jgi:hypothetical protein
MRLVRSSAPPSSSDDNGVSVMRTACALGLAWTVLLAGVTAGAAQTAPERPLPPIRLPGIMYPDQPEAAPTSPERSSKARRSQPPAPLVTPASPPVQPGVVAEPQPPRRTGSVTVMNEPDTTAAVTAAPEAAKSEEPLARSAHRTQQFISPEPVTARGLVLAGAFALACASLGSAMLSFVRRRTAWA